MRDTFTGKTYTYWYLD